MGTTPTLPTKGSSAQRLNAVFDELDAYKMAEQKLYKLRQGKWDCKIYYVEFITLAKILECDERTKISFFMKGLNEEPQKLLLTNVDLP